MVDYKKYKYLIVFGIVIVCLILILFVYQRTFEKNKNAKYNLTVVSRFPDSAKAAKILADLNKFGIELFKKMKEKFYKQSLSAKKIIDRLINNYNPDTLKENDPIFTIGHKTYTMNFKNISMCLRKKNGEFYDKNLLQFVFLHELAHVASVEKDHTDLFWNVFKFILHCAHIFNIYKPVDYSQNPTIYCDIKVTRNPFYDNEDISTYFN